MTELSNFKEFLQAVISPVVIISGVGLLLLSLTNRLGRTIDRARQLVNELETPDCRNREGVSGQLQIFYERSKILRISIGGVAFTILCASLIIPVLLISSLIDINLSWLGLTFLILAIIGIIISAIYLFLDVTLTLKALKLEIKDYLKE